MRPFMFKLQPPRNPLARLLLGIAGVALLGFFSLLGLIIAAFGVVLYTGLRLYRRLRGGSPTPSRPVDPQIIEGEFRVVGKEQLPR